MAEQQQSENGGRNFYRLQIRSTGTGTAVRPRLQTQTTQRIQLITITHGDLFIVLLV